MRLLIRSTVIALSMFAFHSSAPATEQHCHHDLQQQRTCGNRVVEVVFVLDTTGSMRQLISGAKQKIWSIANEIVENDANAIVRMGLIGFRDIGDAYVTKFFDLTEDIDALYGQLLAFRARGGGDTPESVNQALHEAVSRASWTHWGGRNIRLVFLAGDSPPHMDYSHDVKYPRSMSIARHRGITVHTLQAGRNSMTKYIWKDIARLGGGVYAQIPLSGNVQVITTPYDEQIGQLQWQLEDTVIPYGDKRLRESYRRKIETRRTASSAASSADRAEYRANKHGKREVVTGGGDLLAEIAAGSVQLDAVEVGKLSQELRAASPAERKAIIAEKAKQRAALDKTLNELLAKRERYLKEHSAKLREPDAFDLVIRKSIKSAF